MCTLLPFMDTYMDKCSIFGLHITIAHDTSLWDQLLKENIYIYTTNLSVSTNGDFRKLNPCQINWDKTFVFF